MMNLRLTGFFDFASSFLTSSRMRSRSATSLCLKYLTLAREIRMPFWMGKATPVSAMMRSPRLQKAGMALAMVAKPNE